MKNLASNKECDIYITAELALAGIEIVKHETPLNSEVPASITGKLGDFTFRRAWYYWVVEGKMPLASAQKLYDNPIGKRDLLQRSR